MGRLNRKLNLNVLSEERTEEIREGYLTNSMGEMKRSIKRLDLKVESAPAEKKQVQVTPRYEGTDLAQVAREVYRENINPRAEKAEYQDKGPDTHARRVGERSIQRAIMGLRNGGDEGKTSLVGPNGSGNVGKYSPSADMGSGNATNNTDNYYALTTDMTLEEYGEYIDSKFNPVNEEEEVEQEESTPELLTEKDVVQELKIELMKLEDTSWQSIDKVMRQIAKDNYMTPKELHKEFKAQNDGQIPDEWIKEHAEVEMAGFIPLQELARLNPAGVIYTVTYAYRGGTQRRKFLVPHMEPPSKEEMEEYVRGFWPFARVLAFYPDTIDNLQNNNSLVAVPPVTENYKFYDEEDWVTLDEDLAKTYNYICEEEGEPITAPEQQPDGTFIVAVADHDTGEPRFVHFGEGKKGLWDNIHAKRERGDAPAKKGEKGYPKTLNVEGLEQARKNVGADTCWDGYKAKGTKKKNGKEVPNCVKETMSADEWNEKLKAAAASNQKRDKERGMKIHSTDSMKDVQDRLKKRREQQNEAAPFIAAGLGKAAGALTAKGVAKATAGQAAKGGLRKKAAEYGTRKAGEMAQNKITDALTDKEES